MCNVIARDTVDSEITRNYQKSQQSNLIAADTFVCRQCRHMTLTTKYNVTLGIIFDINDYLAHCQNNKRCKRYTIRRGRSRYRVIGFGISFVFVSYSFYMRDALDG